jgi:glycosyltransferase involved in cell wall biosynthesis
MRIGIDARLRAYRGGGIAEHVSRLLDGLASLAPPEEIVVLEHRRAPASGLPFEKRVLRTPPHHVLEPWALPLELWPARLDLLHCTDAVVPASWRGPSVVTVHDVAFLRQPGLLTEDSLRYYCGVRRSVLRADRVITVSDHTRRELEALTDADLERVRVIPNAIPGPFFAPGDDESDDRVIDRYRLRRPYVLFVSTIEPRKNIATLLSAYRMLLDRGHDIGLALAGADGWRSDAVYDLASELSLGNSARFLGFVPDDDLLALYRRAAVLAHPALDEGFGMTPLEAMAAGTPAVVSDVGGLAEAVGDAALLVAPTDAREWAAALGRLLQDPALAAGMRAAGNARARTFTVERMARATLDVYRELAVARTGEASPAG